MCDIIISTNRYLSEVWSLIEVSLLTGELIFTVLWLLIRGMIWIQQKKIVWKREAFLLLMYINLAVLIRFVFYPFFTVNGQVQPLIINMKNIQPPRINVIPLVNPDSQLLELIRQIASGEGLFVWKPTF